MLRNKLRRLIHSMLTKNLLQDDAVEPVTHWHAAILSFLPRTSLNPECRFNVGRSKDRALFLQHFLPDGSDPPPGSSNSSHRKELEPDSLEARAKEFERKRYVSLSAQCDYNVPPRCGGEHSAY
jgi:hypothetical protein